MNKLALVKSESFGSVKCDFWQGKNDVVFMTIAQLANALEYADKSGVEKIVQRNKYLMQPEFSTTDRLSVPQGNTTSTQTTRIFTEDGIYEVTMLSGQPKAIEFRAWVRSVLKALRTGKAKLVPMTEYQKMIAKTRESNVKTRQASILLKIADRYEGAYRQVLESHATKIITGEHLLPLPEASQRTYSATEIGEKVGITANKVGIIANRHNLKTKEYGKLFHDKSRSSNKEVETFRYFENVIPVLENLVNGN